MTTFEQKLQKYAELTVRVGLNIQPGQRLMIRLAPLASAPLVRAITDHAYRAGARLVDVQWRDEDLILSRFKYAPRDSFAETPRYRTDGLVQHLEKGDALLTIHAANPDLLAGQDPELVSTMMQAYQKSLLPASSLIMRDAINWSIVAYPTEAWASKIFPDVSVDEAVEKLWHVIFEVCRIHDDDPIAAWKAHNAKLQAISKYLNEKAYTALKYSAPGTDFTVGLPEGHIWKGAESTSAAGIRFIANLPTEEVFTMPHKNRADGVVTASKPLSYGGRLIENFSLTFKDGKVVDVRAEKGEKVLRDLVEMDDGSGRLGEVALVPFKSPISQSGLLFFNTLFDENAASHLALGRAYKFTMQGGTKLTDDEFAARGGNYSLAHVDFMVGAEQMNVDGITADGKAEPVMRQGEWAFEA